MNDENKEAIFIEKLGLFFEKHSKFPRIAGRIFAYLLICDPPEQSQQQIVDYLKIAKGSASSMLRMLTQFKIIEEFTLPGIRSKLYRINCKGWEDLFWLRLKNLVVVREILKEGHSLLNDKPNELSLRIEELDKFYVFFENEIPLLIERWKNYKDIGGVINEK
ncbi:MAG: transcriptional regulator [Dethiosulfatibacter sp.]|nr:transcriptional regulator [Dethiosulfatibacter sp.]